MSGEDPRRHLPGVDTLLAHPRLAEFSPRLRQEILVRLIRAELALAREKIEKGKSAPSTEKLVSAISDSAEALLAPSVRKVINATGVILHTGLGRAPLSETAQQAIITAAEYCNLEFNLESGDRGERQNHLRHLLRAITGAEDALVVNNNAAAIYLTLNTLAWRKEAIVSRGQLIEIGGSFRLPDIMNRAGVKLVEVGTTNRTRIGDYEAAISPRTALLMRAYPSNYRVEGFTESVTILQLSELAKRTGLIVVDDLGGGVPEDWTELGLTYEPNIRESLQGGADLVMVSGDKVLGGPQCGIILGRADLVKKLAKSPLARVLRADKATIAALSATLREYLHPSDYRNNIPSWRMLISDQTELRERAGKLRELLAPLSEWQTLEVRESTAEAGSGTLPAVALPSVAIACLPASWKCSRWAKAMRTAPVPVIGTVRDDVLWLDLTTIFPRDIPQIAETARYLLAGGRS